jgi:hypothetical protein
MKERLQVQLRHPMLVFVWSFSLLLIGCLIGIRWHPSKTVAISIAISGAILMVIHELSYGFLWISLTAWWIGMHHHADGAARDCLGSQW